jgi:hypothetical protein
VKNLLMPTAPKLSVKRRFVETVEDDTVVGKHARMDIT